MKQIIIIEDNINKKLEIESTLRKSFSEEIQFYQFTSRNETIKFLRETKIKFDLMILDWNFPIYQDSKPVPEQGKNILRELNRQKLQIPVVVCSSEKVTYDGTYKHLLGIVNYDSSVTLNFEEFVKNL